MKRPVLEINKKYVGINFYLFDTLIVVLLIKAAMGYILNEPRILIDTDEIYIYKSVLVGLTYIVFILLFGFSYVLNGKDKIFGFKYYRKATDETN